MKPVILVVEDDTWLGDSYERLLRLGGYTVIRAADAHEAMRQVEEKSPAAVIADILLQGHTIFPLLHELQSYDDTRNLPIILCSNLDNKILQPTRLFQYGVRQVLDKTTLTSEKLVETIQEVCA